MGSNSGLLLIKVDSSSELILKLMSFMKIILFVWEGIVTTSLLHKDIKKEFDFLLFSMIQEKK